MQRNVEIKAKVDDVDKVRKTAAELSNSNGMVLTQEDTFFTCNYGRLKLRQTQEEPSLLVFYDRSDVTGPKCSNFYVTTVPEPMVMKELLSKALGPVGTVRKIRTLFLVGQTRIHLDEVEGLGSFLELEVCLMADQSIAMGETIAKDLMEKLGVQEKDLLKGAYMDMLLPEK